LLKVLSIHFIGTVQISTLLRRLGPGEVLASVLINRLQVCCFSSLSLIFSLQQEAILNLQHLLWPLGQRLSPIA